MSERAQLGRPVVLLADDDAGVRFTLAELLAEAEVDVIEAADGLTALRVVEQREVDLLLADLKMPGLDGLQLLERARRVRPALRVVIITAHGSESHAVRAMKLGAYDYFAKPFEIDDVLGVVRRATETVRLNHENERLRAELALARHMVFRSPAMSRVAQLVERLAGRDVTTLITGESGTGKELVASALVAASPRAAQPLLRFNCAAVPRDLAEAELFGHAQGAFTGAARARPGLFRQAHGGTLLLDEVAELDLVIQGKLLRVLQEGELRSVGEDEARKVDVRIIAATHRDLRAEVDAGRFREDLFYRLHVVVIHVPPLRERPEDLDPLIDHFLAKCAERFQLPACQLGSSARAQLHARSFPGNVRELEHTVEQAVALSSGGLIESLELDAVAPDGERGLGLRQRVEAFERGLILQQLKRCGGNRSEAARQLGIGRVTLLDKLRKYGL